MYYPKVGDVLVAISKNRIDDIPSLTIGLGYEVHKYFSEHYEGGALNYPYIIDDQNEIHILQEDWQQTFKLMGDHPDEVTEVVATPVITSDGGGGQNYYDLPKNAEQLQDLIEYRNMNGNIKDIFKSCYRAGLKSGTSELYDAKKRAYYSLRELGRLQCRKDYVTMAKEIIAHQSKD